MLCLQPGIQPEWPAPSALTLPAGPAAAAAGRTMAAPLLPVIVQENWAQCENPNCNKWRRLPPHFEVGKDRGRL